MGEIIASREEFQAFLKVWHNDQTALLVLIASEGTWSVAKARIIGFNDLHISLEYADSGFGLMGILFDFIEVILFADRASIPRVPFPRIDMQCKQGFYLQLHNHDYIGILEPRLGDD